MKNKILAGIGAAILAVGLSTAVAPAAQASPGDVINNAGSVPFVVIRDGGAMHYAAPGSWYDTVSYIVIPPQRCLYVPYFPSAQWCNNTFNSQYFDVPNGATGYAMKWMPGVQPA